jgi:IS30 family transposase
MTDTEVALILSKLNHCARKFLDFIPPYEVFHEYSAVFKSCVQDIRQVTS